MAPEDNSQDPPRILRKFESDGARVRGMLLPLRSRKPVQTTVAGLPGQYWVMLFSDELLLADMLTALGISGYSYATITDSEGFLDDIFAEGLRLMIDPRWVDGRLRFTELRSWADSEGGDLSAATRSRREGHRAQ